MMKFMRWMTTASLLLLSLCALAQENKEARPVKTNIPYKLTFVISELQDGKKINQRTYVTILNDDERFGGTKLKSGSRVPIITGSYAGTSSDKPITQMQYLDVGVNIEARLSPGEGDWLNLNGIVEISSVLPNEQNNPSGQPILRQSRQDFHSLIHPEKPTILAILDDVNSTRTTQIEVTAARQK